MVNENSIDSLIIFPFQFFLLFIIYIIKIKLNIIITLDRYDFCVCLLKRSTIILVILYYYTMLFENIQFFFLIFAAYLNNTQDNILALDYRDITQHLYPISVLAINQLSTIVANALNTLIDGDVNEKKIHLIGHSLGAHVAGKIGRKTKFKIPRITGYLFNTLLLQTIINNLKMQNKSMFIDSTSFEKLFNEK